MGIPKIVSYIGSFTTTSRDIEYGNGLFIVAYGSSAGYFIQTSTDAVTWNSTNAVTWNSTNAQFGTTDISFLAYGKINSQDYYIAASSTGLLKYSTDLVSWNTSNCYTTSIQALGYGEERFILGGTGGIVRSSTDGVSWNTMSSVSNLTQVMLVAYKNERYFVSGSQAATGVSKARYSTDGVTWITTGPLSTTSSSQQKTFSALVYKNGVYTMTDGTGSASYYNSTDLVSWNTRPINFSSIINIFLFNNGYGSVTSSGTLHTSIDGLSWTTVNATIPASPVRFTNSDTRMLYITGTGATTQYLLDISKGYFAPPTQTGYTAYIKK